MSLLFDYYGELLTEKQKTCFDLYYNQDFSLSEIADELGITRQGVHDTLTRAELLLSDMERKTGCIAREKLTADVLRTICAAAKSLLGQPEAAPLAQQILDAAARIKE